MICQEDKSQVKKFIMNAKYIVANITNNYYRGVIVRFKFEENIMASTRFANISDLFNDVFLMLF
jgi:hypothetical protein